MASTPIRVLCVDDHAFLADGLRARIDAEPDMSFVAHLESADGLAAALREHRPDVVLLDIDMPGRDPFDALVDMQRDAPTVRAIMFSAYVRDRYIDMAYKAGAWGYLSKSDPPDQVVTGIRDVMNGRVATSDAVQERTQESRPGRSDRPELKSRMETITRRELEVLRMIALGMGRTEIAAKLHRSPMTIDNHRKSIMKKLDIHDRGELIRFAIAEGLVEA
ncbi:MAG: response regulator [Phycisphaerales bacterium]